MNRQKGPNRIDWTDYTWNPISGCEYGCDYCYLRRMETRFPGRMKPEYHPERLDQPAKVKKPSLIFTGSSGDMWGEWVKRQDICDVLTQCLILAPHHTYQFLTKNPSRYSEFKLPTRNAWYGTTVDGTERTKDNLEDLMVLTKRHPRPTRFVSFEPLLKRVEPDLSGISWVIIGADSNEGAQKPPVEWAAAIINGARRLNIPVWMKDNYPGQCSLKKLKEMPGGRKPR